MSLLIVTDSSSDLFDTELIPGEVFLTTIPFTMRFGGKEYCDDENLDLEEFISEMEGCKELGGSACPSPQAWVDKYNQGDDVIAFTISSNLSGSHNSAESARDMVLETNPNKNLEVVDSFSTGPGIYIVIDRIIEWYQKGYSFDEIVKMAREYVDASNTVFGLSSFGNLAKNGRVSKAVGVIATALPIWGVGRATPEGTIDMVGKAKGKKGALKMIVSEMEFQGFTGGYVGLSHCLNPEMADKLSSMITEKWPEAIVSVYRTRGLDSFYAERSGLILAYAPAPEK